MGRPGLGDPMGLKLVPFIPSDVGGLVIEVEEPSQDVLQEFHSYLISFGPLGPDR